MIALSKLLGPFNLQLFELLIEENASMRDLAKKANCSPAKVTQFLASYSKNRLVTVSSDKNRKVIGLNKKNPLVQEIISLVFTTKILNSKTFFLIQKFSDSIGVYGSVAEGTVDKQSDIDLWILSDKKPGLVEAGKLKQQFTNELGHEVSLKFFTQKDLEQLKKKDTIFYNELEYKSKILHGEGF
ncbi:nucleotidyltransferase domain-containing protein [Candidatus Micrarchaeota archaeon]|nr:nucleotidyltransferase domain-containing protein [Candidatus Micrarchaeota archaeon]MBU1929869.1 nucleotidyltransferase domain-containing protein [Candidatus Micrarchaeota archaeon]